MDMVGCLEMFFFRQNGKKPCEKLRIQPYTKPAMCVLAVACLGDASTVWLEASPVSLHLELFFIYNFNSLWCTLGPY